MAKRLKDSIWEEKRKWLEGLGYTEREISLMKIALTEGINIMSHEVEEVEEKYY